MTSSPTARTSGSGNGPFIAEFSESTGALVRNIVLKLGDADELSAYGGTLLGGWYLHRARVSREDRHCDGDPWATYPHRGVLAAFVCPNALSFDGTDVSVAAIAGGGTLTEISNTTDQVVRTLSDQNGPSAVASDGRNLGCRRLRHPRALSFDGILRTDDRRCGSLRRLYRRRQGVGHRRENPAGVLSVDRRPHPGGQDRESSSGRRVGDLPWRRNLWALYNGVVTIHRHRYPGCVGLYEFSVRTGALLRVITGAKYALGNRAEGVVASSSRVWILDPGVPGSLAELSARTAARIVAPSQRYDLWQAQSQGTPSTCGLQTRPPSRIRMRRWAQ